MSSWQTKKLGEIGESIIGLTYSPNDLDDDGIDVLRSSNIKDNRIDLGDIVRVSSKIPDKLILKSGDILICARNGSRRLIGKNAYIDSSYEGKTFGAFMCVFRTGYPKFVSYLFQTSQYQKQVERDLGPTINQVTTGNLNSFRFNFPEKPEQQRIVSVLETWDEYLELLDKKIALKERLKKGLMSQLLSGDINTNGITGEWESVKLRDVAKFVNGYTFKSSTYTDSGTYKVITIANVQDGFMVLEKVKKVASLPENIIKGQVLARGDILISMTGNVGRVCKVSDDSCLLNQRVGKIVAKKINEDLLYYLLHNRKFLNKMIEQAQGGAQDNLSSNDICEYRLVIPKSIEDQRNIADILINSDKVIDLLEKQKQIIKLQKQYLLKNLITGKIRTPENLKIKEANNA